MTAVNPEELRHMSGTTLWVRHLASGEVEELPYRKAVGLLSLGRAYVTTKPRKKLPTPVRMNQEGASAENKPPTSE